LECSCGGEGRIISEDLILRENLHSIPEEIALETPLASGVSQYWLSSTIIPLTRDDYS